jgi:hypothetical protein
MCKHTNTTNGSRRTFLRAVTDCIRQPGNCVSQIEVAAVTDLLKKCGVTLTVRAVSRVERDDVFEKYEPNELVLICIGSAHYNYASFR